MLDANTITLNNFVNFVASRSGEYDYLNIKGCAFAQFLHSLGYPNAIVGGYTYDLGPDDIGHELPYIILDALQTAPSTFEALHQRLLAAANE